MAELAKSYMAYANFQKASEFAEKALKGIFICHYLVVEVVGESES